MTPDWEAADERIDKWYHNMQTVKESGMAVATFQPIMMMRWNAAPLVGNRGRMPPRAGIICMVASFIHPHDPYGQT